MLLSGEDGCQSMLLEQSRSHANGCDQATGHYRGRLAPSPTGLLHLGHARTFWTACQRAEKARQAGCGSATMVMRIDDLDGDRCKQEFVDASLEDLAWLGMQWQEGPDVGGHHAPYMQTQRMHLYRAALATLQAKGLVYRCCCSRKDIAAALSAPHQGDEEPVYPGTCRPGNMQKRTTEKTAARYPTEVAGQEPDKVPAAIQANDVNQTSFVQNRTRYDHTTRSSFEHGSHNPQDQEQQPQETISNDAAGIHVRIKVNKGVGDTIYDEGTQQQAVSMQIHASTNVQDQQPCDIQTSSHAETVETSNQGMNTVGNGTIEHKPHKAARPCKQTVNSAAARQQLKAARRAEREARQTEARLASQNKQRSAHSSPKASHHSTEFQLQNKGATKWSWRFRVPDGLVVRFYDNCMGLQEFVCGKDFGDFIVWRHDDVPSYQLACTVDDASMGITEVVRGADLLLSTARQLLLAQALGLHSPAYYHCPLVCDPVTNVRLAKRHDALSLRALRERGVTPQQVLHGDGMLSQHYATSQHQDVAQERQ